MKLEKLILNELKYHLEHEPTAKEIHALSEYLAGKDFTFLVDLDYAITHWAKEYKAANHD